MKPTPATTPPCVECGEPVEDDRTVYARPTCHACLPPPEPLPLLHLNLLGRTSCAGCQVVERTTSNRVCDACWRARGKTAPIQSGMFRWEEEDR